jgi:hypothetical protein
MTSNDKSDENKETKDQNIIIKYGIIPNILMKFGFKHIDADEDGLYDGLIFPKKHSNYLYWTSCLSIGSCLYGLYKRQYKLAIYPLGVFITSVNHWQNPTKGWRQILDQTVVRLALISQTYNAFGLTNFLPYSIAMTLSASCYPLSCYFENKYLPMSTFCHSLIHIGANIGNLILYSSNNDK